MATTVQLELGIPEATRAVAEALAKDSVSFRKVQEGDGFLDSGWLDAKTLEPTRARPLGPGVVRVRAWVNPDREFWSEVVVEATYRPLDDPSRPERELEVSLPENHPLQRRIVTVLRSLVEQYGNAEALRALAPPQVPTRPDSSKRDSTRTRPDSLKKDSTRTRPDTIPAKPKPDTSRA